MKKILLTIILFSTISNIFIQNKTFSMQEIPHKIISKRIKLGDDFMSCIRSLFVEIDKDPKSNFAINFSYVTSINLDQYF